MNEKEMSRVGFYCNEPCIIKADLGEEVVIELEAGEYQIDTEDEFWGSFQSFSRTMIVNKEYITPNQVDFQVQAGNIIKEAEFKTKAIIKETVAESYRLTREATKERESKLKAIESRMKDIEGFEPYLDFLDGKIQYVFFAQRYCREKEYDYRILSIADFNEQERADESGMKAFVFNSKYRKGIEIYLNDYTDYSGSEKYLVKMFKSFKDLKSHVLSILDSCDEISSRGCTDLLKWGISHKNIDLHLSVDADKKKIRKEKEIAELEEKLLALKEE